MSAELQDGKYYTYQSARDMQREAFPNLCVQSFGMVTKDIYDLIGEIAHESMLNRSDVVRLALLQYVYNRMEITKEPVNLLKEKLRLERERIEGGKR